eukprot:Gregarina_sp_Poly_1__145@NODE_1031_length_5291_cov_107_018185_g716_i0_p5_GENE_NODE_1031_length_5291_cov_107_018185_g716_i0NODE_1031_length_5291_cov_107_018185_g716_i0_p5_ORF_typecomplete_len141_score20_58_NODE_1031_length_5291_cov_107_018185_g716_i033673789
MENSPYWYYRPDTIWPGWPSKTTIAWYFAKGVGRYIWGEIYHFFHEVYLGCCTDMHLYEPELRVEEASRRAAQENQEARKSHSVEIDWNLWHPAMADWTEEDWEYWTSPPDISDLRINFSEESLRRDGTQTSYQAVSCYA